MKEDLLAELLRIYATEAAELFDRIRDALRALRPDPANPDQRRGLRRLLHTAKGGAYSAGLAAMGDLVHSLEESVAEQAAVDTQTLLALESALRALEEGIQTIAREGQEPTEAMLAAREDFLLELSSEGPVTKPRDESRTLEVARPEEAVGRINLAELEGLATRIVAAQSSLSRLGQELRELFAWSRREARQEGGIDPAACARIENSLSLLNELEASLQAASEDSNRMRLRPVRGLLEGLRTSFEDALQRTEKRGSLRVKGGEVLLDRRMAERIRGLLVHLVRNAVDHGFESEEERATTGKGAPPQLELGCVARGIRVEFTVKDDGRGIDLEEVLKRARERDLLSSEEQVSEAEALRLVLRAGFSTRDEVTLLSGRGVGLDAVREAVEALNGRLEIDSERGRGTTLSFQVPVSLATERMLVVKRGEQCFAVPLVAAVRLFSLAQAEIEVVGGERTVIFEGQRVVLRDLGAIYGLSCAHPDSAALVTEVGESQLALGVDAVLEEQEVAVRSVGEPLLQLPLVAGLAHLRDGTIAPVTDLSQVHRAGAVPLRAQVADSLPQRVYRILVVDDSLTTRTLERNVLQHVGYEVVVAVDGKEALRHLARGGIDLVITDYEMPYVDGIELLQTMRAHASYMRIPAIMVTSRGDMKNQALAAGAQHHVLKRAFDQEELLDTVARLLASGGE